MAKFQNHHPITKDDIQAVFKVWRPIIEKQIKEDYAQKSIGKEAAIARQQVLERSEKLLLFIIGHDLTAHIVMQWLETEMERCRILAREKESKKSKP